MIFSLQRLLIINEIRIMYNVYNILLIEIDLAQFHPKWEEEERGWCDSEVQCFFFFKEERDTVKQHLRRYMENNK